MGFIHNDELGTMLQEHGLTVGRLDVVDGDNLKWNITEHALIGTHILFQTADSAGTDDFGFQTEFISYLILPLFTKMW